VFVVSTVGVLGVFCIWLGVLSSFYPSKLISNQHERWAENRACLSLFFVVNNTIPQTGKAVKRGLFGILLWRPKVKALTSGSTFSLAESQGGTDPHGKRQGVCIPFLVFLSYKVTRIQS
jgi:hypothetical protein